MTKMAFSSATGSVVDVMMRRVRINQGKRIESNVSAITTIRAVGNPSEYLMTVIASPFINIAIMTNVAGTTTP